MIRKIQLVALFICTISISFSQNESKGKNVVVHTVEPGQTVYSISKQYLLQPDDLKEMNPSIDDSFAIKPGQILRIEIPEHLTNDKALEGLERSAITHTVQPKETLYSISKMYNLSIETLREWNKLNDNTIAIEQPLIVGWKYTTKPGHLAAQIAEDVKEQKEERAKQITNTSVTKQPTTTTKNHFTNNKQTILRERFSADVANANKANQTGVAIWFNTANKLMSSNYYALFSDVPVGSVIKVTNLMNNRTVYAKVIGGLPDTAENHGAMIKLTSASQTVLQSTDGKLRVRVDYAK